jgi:hypothetical protein
MFCNVAVEVFHALFRIGARWRNGVRWWTGDKGAVGSGRIGAVPFYSVPCGGGRDSVRGRRTGFRKGPASERTRMPDVRVLESSGRETKQGHPSWSFLVLASWVYRVARDENTTKIFWIDRFFFYIMNRFFNMKNYRFHNHFQPFFIFFNC